MPVVGAIASVLLHALLLAPALLGSGRHAHPLPDLPSAATGSSRAEAYMTAELIEEPVSARARARTEAPDDLASLALAPKSLSVPSPIDEPPSPPAFADPGAKNERGAAVSSEDSREYARMAGRYLGQVSARIERAWLRPRASIEQGSFACRVRITQDGTGAVKRVELRRCNGDERWRASLVSAIESASPLPAPPDPRVYRRILALDFVSPTYVPGESSEGFESEGAALAGGPTPDASTGLRSNVLDELRDLRMGKAVTVDLRITGSGPPETGRASGAPQATSPDSTRPPLP